MGNRRPSRTADDDVGLGHGHRRQADDAHTHRAGGSPACTKDLYADLGATDKVLVDLGCSSHNAMWEKNHLLLFNASLEWLEKGTVNGAKTGEFKLGY